MRPSLADCVIEFALVLDQLASCRRRGNWNCRSHAVGVKGTEAGEREEHAA